MSVNALRREEPDAFDKLSLSLLMGLARLAQARVVANEIRMAWIEQHVTQTEPVDNESRTGARARVGGISSDELDGFRYVTNASHLVYATTLLDTFLSDTTTFLYLKFPAAMGDDCQVKLKSVLDSGSVADVLGMAVTKRVREISHRPFLARVAELQKTFGLQVAVDGETAETVRDFCDVRNAVVHDQSVFDLKRSDNGEVHAEQAKCARHPTHVTDASLAKATKAYLCLIQNIYDSVVKQVLHRARNEEFCELLETMYIGTEE